MTRKCKDEIEPVTPRYALTPAEAGAALGTSDMTVRRLLTSGKLRGLHLGTEWRIRPEALAAYAEQAEEAELPRRRLRSVTQDGRA
jgi:excisionase family DNA binding protein